MARFERNGGDVVFATFEVVGAPAMARGRDASRPYAWCELACLLNFRAL